MSNVAPQINEFHVVSLSGGKDSTCLLLLMIERGMHIDAVISADTGMELPEMYAHLAKLDERLYRERGLHITTLQHPRGFEYLMFDAPLIGYGWPAMQVRWCTGQLKKNLIDKEANRLKQTHRVYLTTCPNRKILKIEKKPPDAF